MKYALERFYENEVWIDWYYTLSQFFRVLLSEWQTGIGSSGVHILHTVFKIFPKALTGRIC